MPFSVEIHEKPKASDVRSALLGAGEYLGGLMARKEADRGENFAADVRSAKDAIVNLDPLLTCLERAETPELPEGQGFVGATAAQFLPEARSAGMAVVESEKMRQFAADKRASSSHTDIELRGSLLRGSADAEFRAAGDTIGSAAGTGVTAAGLWRPVGQPSDHPPVIRKRRLFVRDLLNVQGTGLASVPYIRENMPSTDETLQVGSTGDTGAAMIAEGTQKQVVDLGWTQDDAPIRKIAAWVPATSEIIEDAPTLLGYIDNRLAYLLALAEEVAILGGAGTGATIKGILSFSGLQSQAVQALGSATPGTGTDVGVDKPKTIGLAISKIELADGEADGVVMHPYLYWSMVTSRISSTDPGFFDGSPGADNGAPYSGVPGTVWGLPVIRSRSVKTYEPIVGCWRLGATLFDREQTNIKVGNQHTDYFTTNRVAIVAEERIGLAVHRPDFFCKAVCHG